MAGDLTSGPGRVEATAAILRVLGDVAPDRRAPSVDVSGGGPTHLAWLGTFAATDEGGDPTTELGAGFTESLGRSLAAERTARLEVLARHDALTPGTDDLRLGWLWIAGDAEVGGASRRLVLPLLSRPVRIRRRVGQMGVEPLGPWDLWPLVADDRSALDLERDAAFGGGALSPDAGQELIDRLHQLRSWVDRVVGASGLPPLARLLAPTDVTELRPGNALVAVVGFAAYVDEVVDLTQPRQTLAAWSRDPRSAGTALASMYLGAPTDPARQSPPSANFADLPPPPDPGRCAASRLPPTLPLNDRQAEVVLRARRSPVTVVSGPPGTGKSQTAAAVALDCVARGESVLLATRSAGAAEVLAALLARLPGPDPVLFGGSVLARRLAARLADGLAASADNRAADRLADAERTHADLDAALRAELGDQAAAGEWATRSLALANRARSAPLLFDPGATVPVDAVAVLFDRAHQPDGWSGGWFGDRRRRRATEALRRLVGAPTGAPLDALGEALSLARLRERARRAQLRDPARSDLAWAALRAADQVRREAAAAAMAADVARRADADGRRAVAALSTALRSGRAARRSHLARVDVRSLTEALPLWVGTLGEIESLLPATPEAFDVVVLDEASQIDQIAASAALLRARRVVVIGDPRQLRFVSFVADAEVSAAVAAQGCGALADRLDVRRVSAFDLAAGAAPVTQLDEHYRSVPHLIGFSAKRFYKSRLLLATRHPANDDEVAIEVRRLAGDRSDGVNQVEVAAAVAAVTEILGTDPRATVGVVSPYRAQVDAIAALVGRQVDLDVLGSGRVRVGTVHGFQGAECDVVVASFGIGGAGDRGRRFLEDPNLFNVLVTRAKRRLIVLSSGDEPTTGLLADYLRWARTPPRPPAPAPTDNGWTARLAAVLVDAGTPVHAGYPVGRWTVDLVVGDGESAVGVATRLHPDGPDAHLARHLALACAGWRQSEAFATDHDGDAVTVALALAAMSLTAG